MQAEMRSALAGSEQMRFSLRASSSGRFWSDFEAATYDISAGIQHRPAAGNHVVVMHLSAPVAGTCRCDGCIAPRIMRPGDIDIVPAGYDATWRDEAPGRVLNVRLDHALIESAARGMRGVRTSALSPKLHVNDPILTHLGWALASELETFEAEDRLFAESVGTAIATHLLRKYAFAKPMQIAPGLSRRQLSDVIAYIHERLAEDLSLPELAAVAGVSPSHFKVLFKLSLGVPVHQYVIRCRVEHATRLLARGDARLCDVAQQSGFAHQSHMTRCMRRVLGVTPAVFLRDLGHQSPESAEM